MSINIQPGQNKRRKWIWLMLLSWLGIFLAGLLLFISGGDLVKNFTIFGAAVFICFLGFLVGKIGDRYSK